MIVASSNRFQVEGVSTAQYNLLDILKEQGSKTAKELSQMRGISQSAISKLVKRLLDKNYVEQVRQEKDRRSYKILITMEGKAFLNRVDDFGNEIMDSIEKALTPEEVGQFADMCRKISDVYSEK